MGLLQRFQSPIKAAKLLLGSGGIVDAASGASWGRTWTNAGAPVNGGSGTLVGFAEAGDLLVDSTNKKLYQNTNTKASPTWSLFETGALAASAQSQPANPVAPASTGAFTMQGLAGAITPTRSGKVLFIVSGDFISSVTTAGDGIKTKLSYGTGAAPANADALVGTQLGNTLEYTNPTTVTAADVFAPFSQQAIITGLALGTAVWLDVAAEAVANASHVGLANLSVTAIEL